MTEPQHDLEALLRDACARARSELPDLALDAEALVAALRRGATGALRQHLLDCHVVDLAVAVAAAHETPGAIEQLERRHHAAIARTCRRFVQPGYAEDDLRQVLRAKLFVPGPDGLAKIAEYRGASSLDAWLRVIATREFIDLTRRKDRPREAAADDDELAGVLAPGDLQLEVIKAEHRQVVVDAMLDAVRSLDAAERHLLRQHLVAGLSIDQLAEMLHVHRATVARRISRARDLLADRTRDLVAARLDVSPDAFPEVYAMVRSKFELSVSRLLATPSPGSQTKR